MIFDFHDVFCSDSFFWVSSKQVDDEVFSELVSCCLEFDSFKVRYVLKRLDSCLSNEGGLAL